MFFFNSNNKQPLGTKRSSESIWIKIEQFPLPVGLAAPVEGPCRNASLLDLTVLSRFRLGRFLRLSKMCPNNILFDLQLDIFVFFEIFISPYNYFVFLNHSSVSTSFAKFKIYFIGQYNVCQKKLEFEFLLTDTRVFLVVWIWCWNRKLLIVLRTAFLSKLTVVRKFLHWLLFFGNFTTPLFL